jgi:hypothetical protein
LWFGDPFRSGRKKDHTHVEMLVSLIQRLYRLLFFLDIVSLFPNSELVFIVKQVADMRNKSIGA